MRNRHHLRLRVLGIVTAILAVTASLGGLVGCGGGTPAPTPTPTRTPQPEVAATAPPPTPMWTPAPSPTPTLSPYVNPLTGERVDDLSVLDRVPVAIKISNFPPGPVRPQSGINSADLIFEHYNEGWDRGTRWTAIYLDESPSRVGPVRSGRLIDLEIPAIYNAVAACWGFSNGVLAIFKESDIYPDQIVSYSLPETLDPDPFYRDHSRDVPLEHTGYTDPGKVRAWAAEHGFNGRQDLQGMVFSEEPTVEGSPATVILVPWVGDNAEWRYDEGSERYLRWSGGEPHIDALTGEQLSVSNVVVLYVSQWDTDIVEDPHSGALSIQWALWSVENPHRPAILFRDGIRIDCTWDRPERHAMLQLVDEDGDPIPLDVGSTFFEVVPTQGMDIVVEE